MPERLLEAVNELTQVVRSLERTLKEDYPRRSEINRRRWQFLVVIILAIIASYFFTIATISTCFLGKAQAGDYPAACKIMPGYGAAQDRSKQLTTVFEHLVNQTEKNSKHIKRLEKKVP